jgi:hypothetical protein
MVEKGKARVLARADLLEAFALCCGQPGAMSWLRHFLSVPSFRGKMPFLVLIVSEQARAEALTAKDLRGVALLFEYRPFGVATGLFCTDDWSGFRTVLSRDSERMWWRGWRRTRSCSAARSIFCCLMMARGGS